MGVKSLGTVEAKICHMVRRHRVTWEKGRPIVARSIGGGTFRISLVLPYCPGKTAGEYVVYLFSGRVKGNVIGRLVYKHDAEQSLRSMEVVSRFIKNCRSRGGLMRRAEVEREGSRPTPQSASWQCITIPHNKAGTLYRVQFPFHKAGEGWYVTEGEESMI
ncbi:hypothetical protein BDZ91DRAFT_750188 [Kalaharituber pfeilii]|nr:hypothetical protein BDZ91DRAFT_750188 [Kalaharituber pfeilii]